ncbi:MAG: VanW family protein [Clostridia bacterium]
MKRLVMIIFIFFIGVFFVPQNFNISVYAHGININIKSPQNDYNFSDSEMLKDIDINNIKVPLNRHARNGTITEKKKVARLMEKQGFSEKIILDFLFVGLENKIQKIEKEVSVHAIDSTIIYDKFAKKIFVTDSYQGEIIDENLLYKTLYESFKKGNKLDATIKLKKELPKLNKSDAKKFAARKSKFTTYFDANNVSRSNNICEALKAFDGKILMPNEELSFNKTTGVRNAENGYLPAKIISNGKYIEGYGGGVCQASTTLYNSALLAGLEIVEVHQHSLKVGYIDASFDAMVSIGNSDLRIKNNNSYPLIISSGATNGMASVAFYGKENEYEIRRKSEIVKVIDAPKTEIESAQYYKNLPLYVGQQIVENVSHNGIISNGYLEYYKTNKLVKVLKIRSNQYSPSAGKIVVGAMEQFTI